MANRSLSSPKIIAKLTATVQNTLDDGSVASAAHPYLNHTTNLADGVSMDQANRAWQYSGTLAEHGDQTIFDMYDLAGIDAGAGAGLDALGQAILFENIVAICIENTNDHDAAGELEVFPSHDHGWTPIGSHLHSTEGSIKGGGLIFKSNPCEGGFDVEDAVSHRMTLRAYGGSVDYSIFILARHDDEESSSSSSSSQSSSLSSSSSQSSSQSSISTSSSSVSTSSISTSSSSSSSWSSASSASSVSSSSSSSASESSSSSSHSSSSMTS